MCHAELANPPPPRRLYSKGNYLQIKLTTQNMLLKIDCSFKKTTLLCFHAGTSELSPANENAQSPSASTA